MAADLASADLVAAGAAAAGEALGGAFLIAARPIPADPRLACPCWPRVPPGILARGVDGNGGDVGSGGAWGRALGSGT